MRYIITIHPPNVEFCYALNTKGSWHSRPKDDPTREPEPSGCPLQYFDSCRNAEDTYATLEKETYPNGYVLFMPVPGNVQHMTLSEIQEELNRTWTLESYSAEFKAGKLPYRDFEHALLHVMKATGKLVAMVEEADHGGESFPTIRTANYLADLVICAIRMASKHPYGEIDIESAVMARIREKADIPKSE